MILIILGCMVTLSMMFRGTVWEYIILIIAMILPVIITFDKILNNPEPQETQKMQGIFILKISFLLFILSFLLEGLSYLIK
jgi:hypothetical protein